MPAWPHGIIEWRVTMIHDFRIAGDGSMFVQHRPKGTGKWRRWTQIRPSKIHGMGLFADRTFRNGEVIGMCDGLGLDPDPTCVTAYKLQNNSSMVLNLTNGRVIDCAYGQSGLMQFAKHYADYVMTRSENSTPKKDYGNAVLVGEGQMVAFKPIHVNEEILFYY